MGSFPVIGVRVHIATCACRSAGISQVIPCARRSEPESGPVHPNSTTPWEVLDSVSVSDVVKRDSKHCKVVRCTSKGGFAKPPSLALEARLLAASNEDVTKETQSWKLFCLLPFWLLRRPQSKGRVGKAELTKRYEQFDNGQWAKLHEEAEHR